MGPNDRLRYNAVTFDSGPSMKAMPTSFRMLTLGFVGFLPVAGAFGADVEWQRDLDRGMAAAREEAKPVLIDFWATWCHPCREMDVRLWSRPEVVALSRKFVCIRVDVDASEGVARRFRADALPTLVVTDPWGTEIARRQGFSTAEDYVGLFKAVPAEFAMVAPWYARVAENRHDLDALTQIARFYFRAGIYHTSREFYKRALATPEADRRPEVKVDLKTAVGWSNLKAGNVRQARKDFERCLKDCPGGLGIEVALYGFLSAHLAAGDRDKAVEVRARLESCCPASPVLEQVRADMK